MSAGTRAACCDSLWDGVVRSYLILEMFYLGRHAFENAMLQVRVCSKAGPGLRVKGLDGAD